MKEKRTVERNLNLFTKYTYCIPGVNGMFGLALLLLAGAILGNIVSAVIMIALRDTEAAIEYATVIAYPVMFLPAMISTSLKSDRNSMFEVGYNLDNNHFKPVGAIVIALMAIVATIATAFMTDIISSWMPTMPEWLEEALGSMTSGNLMLNIISVSIFAPLFEEWLCRGMVLRGLLNFKKDKTEENRGMKPVWAIVISAAFFAIIHLNPWQAIPAFILGCLFGYVYYKTGSLKITMLMHCANNTFAVLMSRVSAFEDADNWLDVLSPVNYLLIFVLCAAIVYLFITMLKKIELNDIHGNCDSISEADRVLF